MTRRSPQGSWLAAFALLVAIFLILPELVVIGVSFNPSTRMVMSFSAATGHWYVSLWQHQEFFHGFVLSFVLAPPVAVCALAFGAAAAYGALRLRPRQKAPVQALFMAPLVVPAAALAVALFLLLHTLRLTDTIAGVVIAHILATVPYCYRTLLAGLQSLDRTLDEAAQSLGASRFAVVRRVTLPQMRPALAASALFALIVSIDEFTLTFFVAGRSVETIPLAIFNNTQYGMDPTVAAASTVLIVISGAVIILLEKLVGLKTAYAVR